MKLSSQSIQDQSVIAEQYAFAKIDAKSRVALSDNLNPQLSWSEVPVETQSFVVICHDSDVPSQGDDVNQPGREVPADLPRVDFFHWVLVDIPFTITNIAEGEFSKGITPRGKSGPLAPYGMRQGINDYTVWFANDHDMRGDYFGYDGPCPPWNDSILHHYVWTVYALDISRVPLDGTMTGNLVRDAIAPHILAQASLTGIYTLNPRLVSR